MYNTGCKSASSSVLQVLQVRVAQRNMTFTQGDARYYYRVQSSIYFWSDDRVNVENRRDDRRYDPVASFIYPYRSLPRDSSNATASARRTRTPILITSLIQIRHGSESC